MKKLSLFVAALLLLQLTSFSQEVIRIQECNSPGIRSQVDSLKQLYAKDGFVVLKEASITMESEYEMPVIVPPDPGYLVPVRVYWRAQLPPLRSAYV
jgi:hypothetical protein